MNFTIKSNGANLNVTAIDFLGSKNIDFIKPLVRGAVKPMMPHLPAGEYFMYIRDLKALSIGGTYPGGNCYNNKEIMIALPSWDCAKVSIRATIAHEMHHLLRWQYAGFGTTLAEAMLSEGLATLYEEEVSKVRPPWSKAKVNRKALKQAIVEWDNSSYDHDVWFFDGKYGHWVGYSVGYKMARFLYPSGIDLKKSFELKVGDSKILAKLYAGLT